MEQLKAGRAVIELLRSEGVEYIFGVTGLTTNSMVTETFGRNDIRFIDTRHEEGAALMAYGYAKVTGKPVACITTSGPGTINLLTGISLAYKGRAPVIVIAGDTASRYIGRDGSQAFDLVNIFKPVTKMAFQANSTDRVAPLIREAFRTAMSGKQGPVLIDIPRDLLDTRMISDNFPEPESYRPVNMRIPGDARAVKLAVDILTKSRRPLLLSGGGIIDSEATDAAVELSELLDMAVVPSYGHHDTFPNSHPNYVGPPGARGSTEAYMTINQADVVLALGTRINQATTSWDYSVLHPDTRIIQVDIDPIEIGRNYPVSAGIVGDARTVAMQLIEGIKREFPKGRSLPEWRMVFQDLRAARSNRLNSEAISMRRMPEQPIMPHEVYPELTRVLPKDCMVTIDAGVAAGLAYDRLSFELPRTMFNYAGQGALGMGYCVGLGTKLGRPDRPALSIQGDGGFLYTSGEINTAVRWNIPLVNIVLNNNCMGAEKAQQKRLHNERYVGVDLTNPRFDKLAKLFGANGYYIENAEDIGEVVSEALKLDKPSVIEIPVQEYFPEPAQLPKN